jgi:hypothetical protein
MQKEDIQRIERAANQGWGFLSPDQEARISRAATNALREPRTSQHRIDRRVRRLCRENPSMSLNVLQAHVDEMVHDLVKEELRDGQGKSKGDLEFRDGRGQNEPPPHEGYQACRPQ